jgi:hypothetical protein
LLLQNVHIFVKITLFYLLFATVFWKIFLYFFFSFGARRKFITTLSVRIGGGSGESEAASYGRLHEKDARKKLEQILGLQIAEAKKVVDKGRRMKLKLI